MSVLAYGLVLLGCADDGSACQRLDLAAKRYVAASQCESQIEAALMSDDAMRADYPIVEARCVPLRSPDRQNDRTRLLVRR